MTFSFIIYTPMPKHTIKAVAGENGSISPDGEVEVTKGESKTFTITAEEGYEIDTLKVDNAEVSVTSSYTFTNVTADHTISVTFKQKETTDPVDYTILDGADSSWASNSDGDLSIRGSGELSEFVDVKVDGNIVDAENYTLEEGSTIVTLKPEYLNTLSVGTHTFEILWTDGSASTTFTISADTADKKSDVPVSGDNTPIVWMCVLSILSGTGLLLTAKKGRKSLKASEK